jgi:anti-sigma-K factor RskA
VSDQQCLWCRDLATEFVLGELAGEERAVVVRHLESCGACRREIASLAATVDATISAVILPAPLAEGFVERVVDELMPPALAGAEVLLHSPLSAPGRRGFGRVLVSAVALCVIVGALTVLVGGSGRGRPSPPPAAVAMLTQNGDSVGRATVTDDRPAVITVAFQAVGAGLSPDGRYQVIAVRRDGGTLQLGTVLVTSGRGGLQARASLPANDIAAIEVVGSNGHNVCSGRLPSRPGQQEAPPPPP